MWYFIVSLPLVFAAPAEYIIGGSPVSNPSKHPWQGSLQFFGGHICGIVLLTPDYVITAAHCTDGRDEEPSVYQMRFNTVTWRDGGALYPVATITPHPGFNYGSGSTYQNDVCIITPLASIDGTGVALDTLRSDLDCMISGWGVTVHGGGGGLSEQLHDASVQIMPNRDCETIWGSEFDSSIHICSTSRLQTKGVCKFDDGGPLVCGHGLNPQLRGVISWAADGCYTITPSIHARVSSLKGWICENAPDADGC